MTAGTLRSFVILALFLAPQAIARAQPSPDDVRAELIRGLDEFDEAQRVQTDQPGRARQLFRSAAQRMQSVAAAGVDNGRLQYDIGNAYLQSGDIGRAILHYRRAERLIPNDPLLKDNLSLARSQRLTAIAATSESQLLRTALFWHYQTSTQQRAVTALILYVVFWLLLTAWTWRRRRGFAVTAAVCAVIAGALASSVGVSRWHDRNQPAGVVLAADVAVYKGPGSSYQRQFAQPLQPGVEFNLLEKRGDWWNIELADGKTGWLSASAAELVPSPSDNTLEVTSS